MAASTCACAHCFCCFILRTELSSLRALVACWSVRSLHFSFLFIKYPFFIYFILKLFFKLYFIGCAIIVVPIFLPFPSSTYCPHPFRPSPPPLSLSMGHVWKCLAAPFPVPYFTSPWQFCNYLFVFLNPFTFSDHHPMPCLSGDHQNILSIHDSVSVLLVCLFCFFRFNCW